MMKRTASTSASAASSAGREKKIKIDNNALIRKELWKKFYDTTSHLGVFKQEVALSSGDTLVFQHGPFQELSQRFEKAIAEDKALVMITELEGILLKRGYSKHAYAPKRADFTTSEFSLFTEDGSIDTDVFALQTETFPPSLYLKKKQEEE